MASSISGGSTGLPSTVHVIESLSQLLRQSTIWGLQIERSPECPQHLGQFDHKTIRSGQKIARTSSDTRLDALLVKKNVIRHTTMRIAYLSCTLQHTSAHESPEIGQFSGSTLVSHCDSSRYLPLHQPGLKENETGDDVSACVCVMSVLQLAPKSLATHNQATHPQ